MAWAEADEQASDKSKNMAVENTVNSHLEDDREDKPKNKPSHCFRIDRYHGTTVVFLILPDTSEYVAYEPYDHQQNKYGRCVGIAIFRYPRQFPVKGNQSQSENDKEGINEISPPRIEILDIGDDGASENRKDAHRDIRGDQQYQRNAGIGGVQVEKIVVYAEQYDIKHVIESVRDIASDKHEEVIFDQLFLGHLGDYTAIR